MNAHVLLISLNELEKRDKMRELSSILSLFCNEFNKFNSTKVIFYLSYDLRMLWNLISGVKTLYMQRCYGRHKVSHKSVNL